jgi:hypothetical protein
MYIFLYIMFRCVVKIIFRKTKTPYNVILEQ